VSNSGVLTDDNPMDFLRHPAILTRFVPATSKVGALAFHFILPNVPSQESPLASGMAPAREAESAGGGTEVPKGR